MSECFLQTESFFRLRGHGDEIELVGVDYAHIVDVKEVCKVCTLSHLYCEYVAVLSGIEIIIFH